MQPGHVKKHAKFPMLLQEPLELRRKMPVIRRQLPKNMNDENPSAVFFFR